MPYSAPPRACCSGSDSGSDAARRRATEIGEGYASFAAGIHLAVERVRELAEQIGTVTCHLYSLLPTWRVVRLDTAMFLSAFGESHEGHTSPMYRLTGSPMARCTMGSYGSPRSCAARRARWYDREARVAVEAEIKAKVYDVHRLHAALGDRATGEKSTYSDRYFDHPDRRLIDDGHELRVRTVTDESGETRVLLTYKEPAVDTESGSKPEHETTAADAEVLVTVLSALGAQEFIALQKDCTNYRFIADGRNMLATVVTVPEMDGQTFIELETPAEPDDVDAALDVVRHVLAELGIYPRDHTTEQYTDAVAARRDG